MSKQNTTRDNPFFGGAWAGKDALKNALIARMRETQAESDGRTAGIAAHEGEWRARLESNQ